MISWSRLPFITSELDEKLSNVESTLDNKQDKLTAGDNITIDENNVISSTGGGGSNVEMESTYNQVNLTVDSETVYMPTMANFNSSIAQINANYNGLSRSVSLGFSDVNRTLDGHTTRIGELEENVSDMSNDIIELQSTVDLIGGETSSSFDAKIFISATATNSGYITLNKGRHLLIGTLYYATNTTGRRVVKLSTTINDVTASRRAYDVVNPVSGTQTIARVVTIMNIANNNTKVYLNGAQNSGSQLSVSGLIESIQIN